MSAKMRRASPNPMCYMLRPTPSPSWHAEGATIYITASPCIECAKLIIQSGITRVVYGEKYRLMDGIELLERAGIEVVYLGE